MQKGGSFPNYLYLCTQVSANRRDTTLLRQEIEPQRRCRYDLCGIIIALVLYSVMSLNLAISYDIIPINKANVCAIAWTTYLV